MFQRKALASMKIVTSGSAYLDIDAYACCIAYAELFRHQGLEARAASSAPLNASVSPSVRRWGATIGNHTPTLADQFIVVDVSDPSYFDPIVMLDKVVEIIDHHPGFEAYWQAKLGSAADIRPIGAAATQIFLRWEQADLLHLMSNLSAALLATAILDNTLNFTGATTTPCDQRAYRWLAEHAGLDDSWPEQYFLECQAQIESALSDSLAADSKQMPTQSALPGLFAQLTVWDAKRLLDRHHETLRSSLDIVGEDWLLNAISIAEQKSYFLAGSPCSQDKLSRLLPLTWQADVAVLDQAVLRKELLKLGLERNAAKPA